MAARKTAATLERDPVAVTDERLEDDFEGPNRLQTASTASTPKWVEPLPEPVETTSKRPTPIKVGVRSCVTLHRADDALSVPTFEEHEFHPGGRIMETIDALRKACQELTLLDGYKIVAFWTSKPIKVAGKEQFGRALRPGGRQKYLTGSADFIIDMSAPTCRGLANYEFEAAVYHQLKHCAEIEGTDIQENVTRRAGTVGHDFEGFIDEVNRYGFWNVDLREAIEPYKAQLKLAL